MHRQVPAVGGVGCVSRVERSDAQLLADAGSDAAAFRDLYERYAERIHGYLLRRTGLSEVAYDLTAETFARAWQSRKQFRDASGGSAAPWLYGIARHVLLMSVRSGHLERRAMRQLGVLAHAADADENRPEPLWLVGLDELLDELPVGQREAVRLRVLDDLNYQQVAAALGTSVQAARVRVHRGLAAIRQNIDQRRHDDQ
jgi:RNA polymerase sigma-70 factor (ECF subfamily)